MLTAISISSTGFTASAQKPAPTIKLSTVVIDPGHGGKDAGCVSPSGKTKEKTVVLITGKGNETRQFIQGVYVDCPSDIDYAIKFVDEYNMKYCN